MFPAVLRFNRVSAFGFILIFSLLTGCAESSPPASEFESGVSESKGPWRLIKREADGEVLTMNREGEFLLIRKSGRKPQESIKGLVPESLRSKLIQFADEAIAADFSIRPSCAGYSEVSGQPSPTRHLLIKVASGDSETLISEDKEKKVICLTGNAKAALRLDSVLRALSAKFGSLKNK